VALAIGLLAVPHAGAAQGCDGNTLEMIDCGMALLQTEDRALNAAYNTALTNAEAGGYVEQLRTAQRLWIPYRDAACAAEAAPYLGGSIHPLIVISCVTKLTQDRTRDLRLFDMN
jgi:uncharacterized protein YecT (DUF1311 family)